jgi:serine protease AprX
LSESPPPDAGLRTCPLCARPALAAPLSPPTLEEGVEALVRANAPGWEPSQGMCHSCAERLGSAAARRLVQEEQFPPGAARILPTGLRLGADPRFTGRGVGIAFLDSGFFAHPDLVLPRDRILRYVDITNPRSRRSELTLPDVSSWHGMMTSVVACGNGRLSDGLYRGLASEAELLLVKCGSVSRIVHDDLRRGFEWILRQRRRYGIRVINVSAGGDYEAPYLHDALSQAVERATRAGILVVAAAGNLGRPDRAAVLPPASAPSALTVGGLDDKNRLDFDDFEMYHSTFGPTCDGLQKPEVIAPGIWVAAPILPGTPTADQAALLCELAAAPDAELPDRLRAAHGTDPRLDAVAGAPVERIREVVSQALETDNLITRHYKHVDGTSFAAPIVSSVAAQMFEADPHLTPQQVKLTLIRTARRLLRVPVDRQGWGVIDPAAAVAESLRLRSQRPAG